ncbi:MAG: MGMT family protein [Ruthenibacterium lactatiformans]
MHHGPEPGIPCHRVVFKDGLCGGLAAGGEGIQRALLEEEAWFPAGQPRNMALRLAEIKFFRRSPSA